MIKYFSAGVAPAGCFGAARPPVAAVADGAAGSFEQLEDRKRFYRRVFDHPESFRPRLCSFTLPPRRCWQRLTI